MIKALEKDKISVTQDIVVSLKTLTKKEQADLATLLWKIVGEYKQRQAVTTFCARIVARSKHARGEIISADLMQVAKRKIPGDKK